MTTIIARRQPPSLAARSFAPRHPWDHRYLLANVALVSVVTVIGFGREIAHRFATHVPTYPLIVHVHAIAFSAWLALLATQIVLIGSRRYDLHKRLGIVGAGLALAMVVLGVSVSFVVGRIELTGPHPRPGFLFVRLADILSFAVLATAAVAMRRTPATHKRLILLATLQIADAGFSRSLGPFITPWVGAGFWPTMFEIFLGNDLLVLGLGAYDLATRKRLHPVYLPGAACIFGCQMAGVWLYLSAWMKPVAVRLLGG